MKVIGIRYCSVGPDSAAQAGFFDALGLPRMSLEAFGIGLDPFAGAIFPAQSSWIELWPQGPGMPAGLMLQIEVDDADAFAAHARDRGLTPGGPQDAHGERIYFLEAPGGLQVSFQSKLAAAAGG